MNSVRLRLSLLFVLILCCCMSCSDNGTATEPPDGDEPSTDCSSRPDAQCAEDTDCPQNHFCDSQSCICIPECGDNCDGDEDVVEDEGDEDEEAEYPDESNYCSFFDPHEVMFDPIHIGDVGYESFSIYNCGESNFEISGIEFSRNSSSDFSLFNPVALPFVLEAGHGQEFTVRFARTRPGLEEGRIIIGTEYALLDIFVSSYFDCGSQKIVVTPESHNFGVVETGDSRQIEMQTENVRQDDAANGVLVIFSMEIQSEFEGVFSTNHDGEEIWLSPDDYSSINVSFLPTEAMKYSAAIIIEHNDSSQNNPLSIPLQGTGGIRKLSTHPPMIDFTDTIACVENWQALTLTNAGNMDLTLCGIDWANPGYKPFSIAYIADASNAVLAPTESTTIHIRFIPGDIGTYNADLVICSDDSFEPQKSISVVGNAIQLPILIEPLPVNFGHIALGESAQETFEIRNNTYEAITVSDLSIEYHPPEQDPDAQNPFSVLPSDAVLLPMVIAPDTSMSIPVEYRPTSRITEAERLPWEDIGILTIDTEQILCMDLQVDLRGTPVWAQCEIHAEGPELDSEIDFGHVPLMQGINRNLIIESSGLFPCRIDQIYLDPCSSSRFDFLPKLIPELEPGRTYEVNLFFNPNLSQGNHRARLNIESNDIRPDHAIRKIILTGESSNPLIDVQLPEGKYFPYNFSLTPINTCSDPVKLRISNAGGGILNIDHPFDVLDNDDAYQITIPDLPPLGEYGLRNRDEFPEDVIEFEVLFCPTKHIGSYQNLKVTIVSNDGWTPGKALVFIGKSRPCTIECRQDPSRPECVGCCANPRYTTDEEICDGYDNDCDGITDNNYRIGEPCEGEGECGVGYIECAGTDAIRCSTETYGTDDESIDELCDGLDNDCDGETDEGFSLGDPCIGSVACSTGLWICDPDDNTKHHCDTSSDPGIEICNGHDDDCDGTIDEGWEIGEACEGNGICGEGQWQCNFPGNGRLCSTEHGGAEDESEPETCDYLDNDCDGLTDENWPIGEECDPGYPEYCCFIGIWECDPYTGSAYCEISGGIDVIPPLELCDGLDNDCDGETDEDFFIGFPCDGIGECPIGVMECADLYSMRCSTDYGGSEYSAESEVCDGLDNDCDGETDENFFANDVCLGAGLCGLGSISCTSISSSICSADPGQADYTGGIELFDHEDNNCDGLIDEEWPPDDDAFNCAACGIVCSAAHAEMTCIAGECVLESCHEGWENSNGWTEDGCESPVQR